MQYLVIMEWETLTSEQVFATDSEAWESIDEALDEAHAPDRLKIYSVVNEKIADLLVTIV